MKKVIIIGCPGSGKSTFARSLQSATGLPLYYLDMMYWNADRTTVARDVFDERLLRVMSGDEWIIDGNYKRTMEMRMAACDTVFFLDFSREVCLGGIRERRGKPRPDMPWIEDPDSIDAEFEAYVESFNTENRPHVLELLKKCDGKTVHVFTSRADADRFLASLK